MTEEQFYGAALPRLKAAERQLSCLVRKYLAENGKNPDFSGIQYFCSRIKTPESMAHKLEQRGFPITVESALYKVQDALGIRIICPFMEDVYRVADWLGRCRELQILKIKDYISYPKANGYRGYHLIVKIADGEGTDVTAEIQIRTIALDFWASLEHRMKYKREIRNEELIRSELKRCADEIASVDLSMQTIRDLLNVSD